MSGPPSSPYAYLRERMRTPDFAKFLRYATVSVISTVLSLVLLYAFYRGANISPGWSNLIASVICTVPSYYLNRTWAWGKTGKSHFRREVLPFWVISFVSLGLSTGAVTLADHEANVSHLSHTTHTVVVLMANFVTYGIIWVGKFLFFNKFLFKHDPTFEETIVLVPLSTTEAPIMGVPPLDDDEVSASR